MWVAELRSAAADSDSGVHRHKAIGHWSWAGPEARIHHGRRWQQPAARWRGGSDGWMDAAATHGARADGHMGLAVESGAMGSTSMPIFF